MRKKPNFSFKRPFLNNREFWLAIIGRADKKIKLMMAEFCLVLGTLSLLGHFNRVQPLLMLSVTPVLFLLWQVKISAVKKTFGARWLHVNVYGSLMAIWEANSCKNFESLNDKMSFLKPPGVKCRLSLRWCKSGINSVRVTSCLQRACGESSVSAAAAVLC